MAAVRVYCEALETLFRAFAVIDLRSRGLGSFRDHLAAYFASGPFRALDEFCAAHAGFVDEVVTRFDREVYVAWLAYLEPLAAAGLARCCPQLSRASHDVRLDRQARRSRTRRDTKLQAGDGAAARNELR